MQYQTYNLKINKVTETQPDSPDFEFLIIIHIQATERERLS